jgi:hypothetical protein
MNVTKEERQGETPGERRVTSHAGTKELPMFGKLLHTDPD